MENGGSDPDAVWHGSSDGSRDEADSWLWEGSFGDKYVTNGDFAAYLCESA